MDPNIADAYMLRAGLWGVKREWDKAIDDITEALRLNPEKESAFKRIAESRLHTGRGVCWVEKEDHDKAIADFTQAIHFDPKFAAAYWHRGMSWIQKREHDKARADFKKAEQLGFSSKDASKGLFAEPYMFELRPND